jgi:solute carrier family 34 (sodium-dependent phosphate cotransporter)
VILPELRHLEHADTWGDLDPEPIAWLEAAEAEAARVAAPTRARSSLERAAGVAGKALTLVAGLWLFILALQLMKSGAAALAPRLENSSLTDGVASALGLGWLGALLVMSGSPVAASALSLEAGGTLSRDEAFAMLTGSRLGAAFVVLVVGFVYALRRKSGRRAPLSIGVAALVMTALAYLPGLFIGLALLRGGVLEPVRLGPPPFFLDLIGMITDPLVSAVEPLDGWLFPLGVVVLLSAFKLIDRLLPTFEGGGFDERARFYVGSWGMFGLGCLVAFITMSVSVALTVLVPLVTRGVFRREQALPYIAGANVTTLGDTLVAAILLGSLDAVRVVVAQVLVVAAVTLLLLVFAWRLVGRLALGASDHALASRPRLAGFVAALFCVPIALIALR